MLTPSKNDPNRAKELKRKEADPISFGGLHEVTVQRQVDAVNKKSTKEEK